MSNCVEKIEGYAKLNPDFKEGRPKKFTKKQIDHTLMLLKTQSYKEVGEKTGISESTLLRAKKAKEREGK